MERIINQHFTNETITFDGFSFVGCTFTDCVIIIASLDFNFESCSFYGSAIHVNPKLPIFEISHRLSQSIYDNETSCSRDNFSYPRNVIMLPV